MSRRVVGAVLVLVAALLVLIATLTKTWFSHSESGARLSMGLISTRACVARGFGAEECRSETMSADAGSSRGRRGRGSSTIGFVWVGRLTFGAGLVTGLFLALAGGLALAGWVPALARFSSRIGMVFGGFAAVLGIVFVASKPELLRMMSMGAGCPLLVAGGVLAGIGGWVLALKPTVSYYTGPGATVGEAAPMSAVPPSVVGSVAPAQAPAPSPVVAIPEGRPERQPPAAAGATTGGAVPACVQCGGPTVWKAGWFCDRCGRYN